MPQTSWDLRFLDKYDRVLRKKFKEAEDLAGIYPDSSLAVFRAFSELLLGEIAKRHGVALRGKSGNRVEKLYEFINRLAESGYIPAEQASVFHEIRMAGNQAAHLASLAAPDAALDIMAKARSLAFWFESEVANPPIELPPERRIGIVFHAMEEGRHYFFLVKNGRYWVPPSQRIAPDVDAVSVAQSFADKIIGSKVALRGPIIEESVLRSDWESEAYPTSYNSLVVEESKIQPVMLFFYRMRWQPHRDIWQALRRIVVARHGHVKLVLMNEQEGAEHMRSLGVQEAPAIVLFEDGRCVEILAGTKTEIEIDAWLQSHSCEIPFGGPIVGRIRTIYFAAHSKFEATALINSRIEYSGLWYRLPDLLHIDVGDGISALSRMTEIILSEAKKAAAEKRAPAFGDWFLKPNNT